MWHRNVGALLASLALVVLGTVPVVPAAARTLGLGPSSVALTSSLNPADFGASVSFVARVLSTQPVAAFPATVIPAPTGSVAFFDGSTALGTVALDADGTATLTTSTLLAGHHSVVGHFSGDETYARSSSDVLDQVVVGLRAVTTLTANPSTSTFGQAVTFTVTVTGTQPNGRAAFTAAVPTGWVSFLDGGEGLDGVDLSAQATAQLTLSTLAVGTHAMSAQYAGDDHFAASTSGTLSYVVTARHSTVVVAQTPVASTPDCVTQTMTVTLPHTAGVVYSVSGSLTLPPGESVTVTPSAARGFRLATGSHSTRFTNTLDVSACSGQVPVMAVTGSMTTVQVLWALSLLLLGSLLTWLGRRRRA